MNLTEVFERKFNVLQNCPHHVRGRFRHASRQALEARSDAVHNDVGENRAWKLFCLLLFFLRGGRNERVSKAELCHRFRHVWRWRVGNLFDEAIVSTPTVPLQAHGTSSTDTVEQRAKVALSKVQMGEVSRARQCLTGATIAAGTDATLQEMQSRRPQGVVRNITQRIMEWQPEAPVVVDRKVFVRSLKSVPRGSSPGPGGYTFEHLRCLLDETETTELLRCGVQLRTGISPCRDIHRFDVSSSHRSEQT